MGANISWGWRKLLSIRTNIRSYMHLYTLGDGTNTSAWFDQWADFGPLLSQLSYRAINNVGFHLKDKVADIVNDNAWTWPYCLAQSLP